MTKPDRHPNIPTPAEIAAAEQGQAMLADILPPYWRRLYMANMDAGFSKDEALSLVRTYILSQAPHGVHHNK